jgi:regulator of RNase E activity RraA
MVGAAVTLPAQELAGNSPPEAVIYLQNKPIDDTEDARREILELFDGLRVADVSDGMDRVGLPDVGVMDRTIMPLWRDTETMGHVLCGFAFTIRFLPTNRVPPNPHPEGDYMPYQRLWYGSIAASYWMDDLRDGDVMVVDAHQCGAGFMGSNNSIDWRTHGVRGVVTNDGPRDTDEIAAMRIPVYCATVNYGTNIGRVELESWNRPINCGGALVYPGDVIVADGDGVIVVPRERALEVGRLARAIHDEDEASRAGKLEE